MRHHRNKAIAIVVVCLFILGLYNQPWTPVAIEEEEAFVTPPPVAPLVAPPLVTKFDLALSRYAGLHRENKTYVSAIVCGDWHCPGWGDQLKGILSAFTLALLLDRAFIIRARSSYDLSDIYFSDKVDWRPEAAVALDSEVTHVDCWMTHCSCVLGYRGALGESVIGYRSGTDCSGAITRMPEFAEEVKALGILEDTMWRTKVFDLLFQMRPLLSDALRSVLKQEHYPYLAMHMRTGGKYLKNGVMVDNPNQPKDNVQESGKDIKRLVATYASCLVRTASNLGISLREQTAYLAADNEDAITEGNLTLGPLVSRLVTGEAAGGLGHISKGKEAAVRTFVEFEVLRHSSVLLAGESGFSLMAYKVRALPTQVIVNAWSACEWPWQAYHVFGEP